MTLKYSSRASRELIFQLVLENIDQKKRSKYLQEIIAMSRTNDELQKMLSNFFIAGKKKMPLLSFCKN